VKPIDIYLGLSEGALDVAGEAPAWHAHADLSVGLDGLFREAAARATGRWSRRVPVRLWWSGALARPFVCGPVEGLRRWREALALAQSLAPDATGLGADCVVTVEDWPGPQPTLATATAATTLAAVHAAAALHRVNVRAIRPWWAAAANHARTADSAATLVAARDGDALTLLGWQSGRWHTANAYLPAPSPEQAERLLARLAVSVGVAADSVRQVVLSRTCAAADVQRPFLEPLEVAA